MAPSVYTPFRTPTILVVDDTPSILDLIRASLEEEGYRVATCLRSRDALRLAREERPDAILLDMVMPEMSGWDVLEQLRADPRFARIPVIVCTAYLAEALGRLPELRGPTGDTRIGLLPKPFDMDELVEVVATATGATRANH
jgi:CheY-like chemotaxis protein